jgi:hypothetical protein
LSSPSKKFKAWFFQGITGSAGASPQDHWWRVMCLTGVDYFSSMGFQPGISFLAAGLLSPLATLNLVILTLFGALPAYWVVVRESPYGQGSFAIFERVFRGWMGKTLVLVLLGFAATDFVFTITMCAADATAHLVQNPLMQNPLVPAIFHHRLVVTFLLIAALGGVFLKGFRDAVRISVWLVVAFLAVNLVVLCVCVSKIVGQPDLITVWLAHLHQQYSSVGEMFLKAALAFPQLALGLSGFETAAAVMPMIQSRETTPDSLNDRIRNTRLMLVTVALIMSVFLLVGSVVTTLLIPAELFAENGPANGRALAYLAHLYLGDGFGTVYDISTIGILWYAGASSMAALLTLSPQYLPRYGMAPSWAAARRPLVVFFTVVSLIITFWFQAKIDAQAGAFATGLLVMITSATVAVTIIVWKQGLIKRLFFSLISAAFVYSSVAIVFYRPDGLSISLLFIGAVLISSLVSRALRSTELRVRKVHLDAKASEFIEQAGRHYLGEVRLLAVHKQGDIDYEKKVRDARRTHSIQEAQGDFIILEVSAVDCSEFLEDILEVTGHETAGYQILSCVSPCVPNAIAALLLYIRNKTGKNPHVYFTWTEGHPLALVLKYMILGEGETAQITREVLRSAEPDPLLRPNVHVG